MSRNKTTAYQSNSECNLEDVFGQRKTLAPAEERCECAVKHICKYSTLKPGTWACADISKPDPDLEGWGSLARELESVAGGCSGAGRGGYWVEEDGPRGGFGSTGRILTPTPSSISLTQLLKIVHSLWIHWHRSKYSHRGGWCMTRGKGKKSLLQVVFQPAPNQCWIQCRLGLGCPGERQARWNKNAIIAHLKMDKIDGSQGHAESDFHSQGAATKKVVSLVAFPFQLH